MTLAFIILALTVGFPLLLYSAKWFCDGAIVCAQRLNVPVIVIALTLVPIGTSAPELAVSLHAAFQGNADIAYGSVIGSNIANLTVVCIILGFFYATSISRTFREFDLPALFCFYLLLAVSLLDYRITTLEGVLLLLGLGVYLCMLFRTQTTQSDDTTTNEYGLLTRASLPIVLLLVVASLALVLISAEMLIWGATSLAHLLGISDLVISLTILAIGTSLPEIVVSVVAAHKGRFDLAIANVLGSNLYNIALILGLSSIVTPIKVAPIAVWRDFWFAYVMLLIVLICLYFFRNKPKQINKTTATILLLAYGCYLTLLTLFAAV